MSIHAFHSRLLARTCTSPFSLGASIKSSQYSVCRPTYTPIGGRVSCRLLSKYLRDQNVAPSCTTYYSPQGNGKVERLNDTWRTIYLALRFRGLPLLQWDSALPDAVHSIRLVLCTATNCMLHERLFNFPRRQTIWISVPTWITAPGPVLLKRLDPPSMTNWLKKLSSSTITHSMRLSSSQIAGKTPVLAPASDALTTGAIVSWVRNRLLRQTFIPQIWQKLLGTSHTHWRGQTLHPAQFLTYSSDNKELIHTICKYTLP